MLMIDPGVYELKKSPEYSRIDELHALVPTLGPGEFISIDYPCDMNEAYTDLFIKKTYDNNMRYKDEMRYICTVQSRLQDFDSFKEEWYKLEDIWMQCPKIIGIGNLCRIMKPNEFTDNVFDFIIKHVGASRWIHVYGMALRIIKKYVPMMEKAGLKVSVDSTKWTRAATHSFKKKYGVMCRKANRDLYFWHYMNQLKERGLDVKC
jgi:hypothetical protein